MHKKLCKVRYLKALVIHTLPIVCGEHFSNFPVHNIIYQKTVLVFNTLRVLSLTLTANKLQS